MHNSDRRQSTARLAAAIGMAVMLLTTSVVEAQRRVNVGEFGRNGEPVRSVFAEPTSAAQRSVVQVRVNGQDAALGTVVGADGWILTKASEMGDRITVRLPNGRSVPAQLIGVSQPHDLAMLRADVAGLTPITWAEAPEVVVGQWVVTPGTDGPMAVGVLSVGLRRIPAQSGILGVGLQDGEGGVRVQQVLPDSGAETAGIQVDDLIVHIAGRATITREELVNAIQEHRPGDQIRVGIRRGDAELEVLATLQSRVAAPGSRAAVMNRLSGPLSRRSNGFPAVIQHDTVLRPQDCGGPLVNLDGQVIGVNIARAGRTESYAIPADVVASLLPQLMAPQATPEVPEGDDED